MANGRQVFFAVAAAYDYSRQYLDRRAVYLVDEFGNFNEYSRRLLRSGTDRRRFARTDIFRGNYAVYAAYHYAVFDNAIRGEYQ